MHFFIVSKGALWYVYNNYLCVFVFKCKMKAKI